MGFLATLFGGREPMPAKLDDYPFDHLAHFLGGPPIRGLVSVLVGADHRLNIARGRPFANRPQAGGVVRAISQSRWRAGV
jgi:hypothetical protein